MDTTITKMRMSYSENSKKYNRRTKMNDFEVKELADQLAGLHETVEALVALQCDTDCCDDEE